MGYYEHNLCSCQRSSLDAQTCMMVGFTLKNENTNCKMRISEDILLYVRLTKSNLNIRNTTYIKIK
jgi:hypothetical protein